MAARYSDRPDMAAEKPATTAAVSLVEWAMVTPAVLVLQDWPSDGHSRISERQFWLRAEFIFVCRIPKGFTCRGYCLAGQLVVFTA